MPRRLPTQRLETFNANFEPSTQRSSDGRAPASGRGLDAPFAEGASR
jgi:hypothetical protein